MIKYNTEIVVEQTAICDDTNAREKKAHQHKNAGFFRCRLCKFYKSLVLFHGEHIIHVMCCWFYCLQPMLISFIILGILT